MEQKGTKETSCYVEEHITLQFGLLFMGKKNKLSLCTVELNKNKNSWIAGVVAKLSAHAAESSLNSQIKS